MLSLKPNLIKRIERLPKLTNTTGALQPLFEAISNAIHSTQNKFGDIVSGQGKVVVSITTRRRQAPVSITVEDNGTGLDERNFEAFTTTDTDNKILIGGKGVGRLLWLDCFESITVNSIYVQEGRLRQRQFKFVLALENQIQEYSDSDAQSSSETQFFMKFDGLRDNGYRAKFPGRSSYVFQHVISHFLPTFIGGRSPQITVHCGDETRHYPAEINSIVYRRSERIELNTKDFGTLTLTLMECDKVASANLNDYHFVHFIAHDRTVHSQRIDGRLGLKYFGDEENSGAPRHPDW